MDGLSIAPPGKMYAQGRPLPKSAEKTLATVPNIHYTIYSQSRKEQNL